MTRDSALIATDPMPGFMNTSSWTDRQAHAALASWISTHQTPTFATRSDYRTDDDPAPEKGALVLATERESLLRDEYEPYRQRADAIENKPSEGYVEPAAHTYAELAALTRMLHQALGSYGMLDTIMDRRLSDLTTQLETLQDISTRELNRQRLTDEDFEFIHSFAENFSFAAYATDASSRNITQLNLIASAPPDTQVLHEATGILRMLVLVHKNPGRGLRISVGPIYSYYEFKKMPEDALSPEEWSEKIERGKQFNPPEWTESFYQ
jgi:hypothetical protein